MKVLHLYSGNLYGGVERFLGTLAQTQSLFPSLEHHFGLCFRGRLWDQLSAAGAPTYDLGSVRFSRPWTALRARRRLGKVLAARRFDVVVCHCCWPLALFGTVARRSGHRVVYWAHDAGLTAHDPAAKPALVERLAARIRPDLTLAISDYTKPFAQTMFPGVPTVRYYCPVQLRALPDRAKARAAIRAELLTAPDDVVILQTSRMASYKGHQLLLSALGKLRDLANWTCWMAGGPQQPAESEYFADLKATAERLGIASRVRFLGERTDVDHLLSGADVHCQPNTRPELFGITFIEGLAAALPVVSTRIGAAVEILDGYGLLVAPDDPSALANAFERLIVDPAQRAALGAIGPARAAQLCDPAKNLDQLHSIFRDQLGLAT